VVVNASAIPRVRAKSSIRLLRVLADFTAGSIAVSPNGTSAYATANSGDCNASPTLEILQYNIGAGGLLIPKTPATVEPTVGDNVGNVAISPDGSSVYATADGSCSSQGGNILQYAVGAGGVLSPDDPAAVAVGTNPFGLVVVGAAPTETLTVSLAGAGAGSVTGSGISCPGTCSHGYTEGTTVTLTAARSSNSTFAGWSGAGCSGKGSCTVTLDSAVAVSATFDRATPLAPVCRLTVRSDKVVLKAPKHKHGGAKPGTLALTARCSEAASLRLTAKLVELLGKKPKHGKQKTKSFAVGPPRATCKAGKPTTLIVKLPAAALRALKAKAKESATFTLEGTNSSGHGRASAKVGSVRAAA
jgi:Divergent InlB B-repeat domain